MFVKFREAAEVAVNPAKPAVRLSFKAGEEVDLIFSVAETLVKAGVAERADRKAARERDRQASDRAAAARGGAQRSRKDSAKDPEGPGAAE